jgi:hypothetical protein
MVGGGYNRGGVADSPNLANLAPASQPAFEAWNGTPFAHGMEHFELRMQLPVVGLGEPI